MIDEAKQYYSSTEQAFHAGQRRGKELQKQETEEEGQHEEGGSGESKLTMEELRGFSAEEHIERKAEVDAFLEEQGK